MNPLNFKVVPHARRLGRVLWAIALLSIALAPRAASAKVTIEVEVGYHETFKSGGWTPIRVLLDNGPDEQRPSAKLRDFNGEVRITVVDLNGQKLQYVRPVELPQQSRKLVEFSILISERSSPIVVEFVDPREGIVARTEYAPATFHGNNLRDQRRDWLEMPTVLLVADPNETATFPNWLPNTAVNIQRVERRKLPPDYKAYENVRAVVVRQRLTGQASDAQIAALRQWLRLGGTLVFVTPRAQSEMRQDPFISELLPAGIIDVNEVRIEDLAAGSGDEMTLMADWDVLKTGTEVLLNSPAGAIALTRRAGAGRVVALAVDPSSLSPAALRSPAGRQIQMLTEALVLQPSREDLRARHYWATANVDPGFSSILLLPSIWVVTGLLALFVIVVGPLNFAILRKRRRLELAWFTIPALSILFFFAVYIYGVVAKGGDQHYASAEIVHLSAGEPDGLMLWSAIQFAPRKRVYTFEGPEGSTVLPLMAYYDNPANYSHLTAAVRGFVGGSVGAVETGNPGVAVANRDLGYILRQPAEQWSMEFYEGESPATIDGNIDGKVKMTADGNVIASIQNNTPAMLVGATLFIGEMSYSIGDIEPNAKIEREFPKGQPVPPQVRTFERPRDAPRWTPYSLPSDDSFHSSAADLIVKGANESFPIFRDLKPQRRCRLIARQEAWTSNVGITPDADFVKTCAMVEVDLPLDFVGEVKANSATVLRGEIYDFDPNETTFFMGGEICKMRNAWIEFLFAPPETGSPARFVSGELIVNHAPYTHQLSVYVFNYSTGSWDLAAEGATGSQQLRSVVTPQWVNPIGNLMRVRLVGKELPNANSLRTGNYGVSVQDVHASMTLAGAPQEPPPAITASN